MNLHDSDVAEEAAQKKAIEVATNLLQEDVSPEIIARSAGLQLEEVLELQKSITVTA